MMSRKKSVGLFWKKYLPETFDYTLSSISSWIVEGDWNEDDFIQEIKRRYVKESVSHMVYVLDGC